MSEATKEVLRKKNFTTLFPIQEQCFAPVFNGKDLIARDVTGSGKTLAFCAPLVDRFRKAGILSNMKLKAMILAPTRELAQQICKVLESLCAEPGEFKTVCTYGGMGMDYQSRTLEEGVDFLVGTTGRTLDFMNKGLIDMKDLQAMVLDEADRMFENNFMDDIQEILGQIDKETAEKMQKLMFSATFPPKVTEMAQGWMNKDYLEVDLAKDLKNKTAKNVNHISMNITGKDRINVLADILAIYGKDNAKILVFTQTKEETKALKLSHKLSHVVEVMHGDLSQFERNKVLKDFKAGIC